MAIETGLREGDEGRGISYVFAGGNGSNLESHDNSNLDGYANFYGVTAVCAIDHNDVRSSYSEPGANLWVCAPSSGADPPDITTTDVGGTFAFFGDAAGSGYWPGLYTDTFGGTSAATPIVSRRGRTDALRQPSPDLARCEADPGRFGARERCGRQRLGAGRTAVRFRHRLLLVQPPVRLRRR